MGYTYLNLLDSPELSSNLNDFNYRNKALTAKLLRQGYRYFKLRKAFSEFYRRHSAFLEKYSVSLKTLLQQGITEPGFYGDLVYSKFTCLSMTLTICYTLLYVFGQTGLSKQC